MPAPVRKINLVLAAVLLVWTAARAPAEPPDPDQEHARALEEARLVFQTHVFDGEQFPACDFDQPDRVKGLIGPYSFSTTFFDRGLRPVDSARAAGLYGAVVEMTSESGRTLRRDVMLFRAAKPVAPGYCFDPAAPAELARWAGLDVAVVRRHADGIAGVLKDRPFRDFAHDPRAARLLAGLSLAKDGSGPAAREMDVFSLERKWWDDLRGKPRRPK
jgi:hypothetical protein